MKGLEAVAAVEVPKAERYLILNLHPKSAYLTAFSMRFLGFAIRDMSRRLSAKPPVTHPCRHEWHPVAGREKDFRALWGAHEAKARQTVLWRFYCPTKEA